MSDTIKVKFNEYFEVDKKNIDNYGFFNISLVSDLPLFIDPFHLFYSEKEEYINLHNEIIKYLIFLKNISNNSGKKLSPGIINSYYKFPEVKQNWFGFSSTNNSGRGLGPKFAKSLNDNFNNLFLDFGSEKQSHHLEKLTLITERVGKDSISDFTTNLIHGFLAKKTEDFAKDYIDEKYRKNFTIKKAEFDYHNQVWKPKTYNLPFFNNDYVLLTPKDLLTKNDIWINKYDFVKDFAEIPVAMSNVELRLQLSNYFNQKLKEYQKTKLNKKTNKLEGYQTQETRTKATIDTVKKFPQSIDVYIKLKEQKGELAKTISNTFVFETESFLENQFSDFVRKIELKEGTPSTYKESIDRALYFKECIELHDCYTDLYIKDKPVNEDWIQKMFWLVWFGTDCDLNRESNNGLGRTDFTISKGKKDKTIIELKLASSNSLEKNILNQLEKYKEVNKTDYGVWIIVFFSEVEYKKVFNILKKYSLENQDNYILIDARRDNKISASKIK